jgi:hypothetical protein
MTEKEKVVTTGDLNLKEETTFQLEHRLGQEARDKELERSRKRLALYFGTGFLFIVTLLSLLAVVLPTATAEQKALAQDSLKLIAGGVIGYFLDKQLR